MIRIALPFTRSDNSWMGGVNYLVNLVHAVAAIPDPKIEFVLLLAPEAVEAGRKAFPAMPYLTTNLLSGRAPARILSKGLELGIGRNIILERFLKRHGISLISHAPSMGPRSRFPAITWIPDFQHVHLPHFFTEEQIAQREAALKRSANGHNLILLSSEHAKADFAAAAPQAVARTRVLRFVSGLEGGQAPGFDELQKKYALDEHYFHLPNQFWQHKNHALVVDALSKLKERGISAQVICTGHTDDFRHPEYFAKLQAHISERDISDNLRILGVVPYADVRGLMSNSIAVLNPSRFEGWSTSVEESKSLGKTILLSDIAVHREQAPPHAGFFDPDSPEQLADHMANTLREFSRARDKLQMDEAKKALLQRFMDFGRAYEALVTEAVAKV